MSALQTTPDYSQAHNLHCSRCGAPLPEHATFCGACGERVKSEERKLPQPDTTDVAERYRITSLIRRSAYVQLFLALDSQQQKPVVICDIDISSLSNSKRTEAIKAIQREYDLLHRYKIPDVMPVIDLRYFQSHLFTIAGWPFATTPEQRSQELTLQDLLQSGIGLPDEQTALAWTLCICKAVSNLHTQLIVIGDLDPYTIIVSENTYKGTPALMVGWLPLSIRGLFPHETTLANTSHHFTAPELLLGNIELSSDIYSIGAILYLLLTGTAPEEPEQRKLQGLHSPRELNPRVSASVDALVMRALALNFEERFESAEEMVEALQQLCSPAAPGRDGNNSTRGKQGKQDKREKQEKKSASPSVVPVSVVPVSVDEEPADDPEDVTISVAPIQTQLARWHMARIQNDNPHQTTAEEPVARQRTAEEQRREEIEQQPTRAISQAEVAHALVVEQQAVKEASMQAQSLQPVQHERPPESMSRSVVDSEESQEPNMMRSFKARITGVLPALPHLGQLKGMRTAVPLDTVSPDDINASFLKRLQHFILGEQHRSTTAAALIETPLRIQPNQGYALRIHLMGRDAPSTPLGARKGTSPAGLSALMQGEKVHIEVRSALFQNYAYIIQQANVQIPARGYAAEVTIPMQALTTGPSGRRERLHIFFMDDERKPLYEKPFVIELFISHLVQSGREGHNVLNIPL